jgi:hypothetical protein
MSTGTSQVWGFGIGAREILGRQYVLSAFEYKTVLRNQSLELTCSYSFSPPSCRPCGQAMVQRDDTSLMESFRAHILGALLQVLSLVYFVKRWSDRDRCSSLLLTLPCPTRLQEEGDTRCSLLLLSLESVSGLLLA